MNDSKTIQVLQEIFRQCGPEVLLDRHLFLAYLEDLLNGSAYALERRIFQLAMDSSALRPLAKADSITEAMAESVAKRLQTENRMLREDAEFAVRCIVAALGKRADFSGGQAEPDETRQRAEEVRQEEEERRPEGNLELLESEAVRKMDAEEFSCKIKPAKALFRRRGIMTLYPDSLLFVSNKGKRIEFSFTEIQNLSTRRGIKWFVTLLMLAGFAVLFAVGYFTKEWYKVLLTAAASAVILLPFWLLLNYKCNRSLLLITYPAQGLGPKRHELSFYTPADKKRALSFFRTYLPR